MNNLHKVEKTIDNKALLIKNILKDNLNKGHISLHKITENLIQFLKKKYIKNK